MFGYSWRGITDTLEQLWRIYTSPNHDFLCVHGNSRDYFCWQSFISDRSSLWCTTATVLPTHKHGFLCWAVDKHALGESFRLGVMSSLKDTHGSIEERQQGWWVFMVGILWLIVALNLRAKLLIEKVKRSLAASVPCLPVKQDCFVVEPVLAGTHPDCIREICSLALSWQDAGKHQTIDNDGKVTSRQKHRMCSLFPLFMYIDFSLLTCTYNFFEHLPQRSQPTWFTHSHLAIATRLFIFHVARLWLAGWAARRYIGSNSQQTGFSRS